MMPVGAGSFIQGQNGDGSIGNLSVTRTVTLSAFTMSMYEVSQGQYAAVMESNPSNFKDEELNRPVERVNWYDAIIFCNKLSTKEGLNPVYHMPGYSNSTDPDYWITQAGGAVPTTSNSVWNEER